MYKIKHYLLFLLLFINTLEANERALFTSSFKTEATALYLPVTIDGKSCSFLFDTGASFVVLDEGFRSLLGKPLSLKEAEARTGMKFASKYILTPNGEVELEMFKAIPLRLGRLQVANRFPYLLADLQALYPFAGEAFCGILGISFLHQFRWEIDFDKQIIQAFFGAEPYMKEYDARTPIFWSKAGLPQIVVNFSQQEGMFDIDTGDNGSGRLHRHNVKYLKAQDEISASHLQEVVTVSEISTNAEYRLKELWVADQKYTDLVLQESLQNAIGLQFLKRHNIIFDFPFNMLYMNFRKGHKQREEVDKSGLRVVLVEGKLRVHRKKEHPKAEIKGLEVGDEIISVKGIKDLNLYTMRKLLRGQEGQELFLQVAHEGKVQEGYIRLGKDPL